ncbi:Dabb family protein [Lampropedia puyangensis]|uniref:Dabb family protein n=1 Tax=Lampropedia puyangensis TaxID=1330072 RepID=A0A4S8EZ91_9BURK|nr:Dabb family protein [Lampropedia puyangensis]THU00258.1 Dabb family protein [Lampropedia puyangensis]
MTTLKHIVMWKLHEHAEGADKATNVRLMKDKLLACAQLSSGTLRFEVVTAQEAHAQGLEATYDIVLFSEFTDKAALDAYAEHPQHVALKGFIGAIRESRQCMDWES